MNKSKTRDTSLLDAAQIKGAQGVKSKRRTSGLGRNAEQQKESQEYARSESPASATGSGIGAADVANRDEQIEQLHNDMSDQLLRVAWAILRDWQLAADAVQEAFGVFTAKFDEIPSANRPGWLIKAVQFQAKNLRRSQQRASVSNELVHAKIQAESTCQTTHRFDQEELQQALLDLPDPQKTVILRRLVDEQTFAEIADDLGLPLGTVLSRMRLALHKLRVQVRKDDETS